MMTSKMKRPSELTAKYSDNPKRKNKLKRYLKFVNRGAKSESGHEAKQPKVRKVVPVGSSNSDNYVGGGVEKTLPAEAERKFKSMEEAFEYEEKRKRKNIK